MLSPLILFASSQVLLVFSLIQPVSLRGVSVDTQESLDMQLSFPLLFFQYKL
nr:MAG TPA: hypothetical protein [Caudoviricetes sp.]